MHIAQASSTTGVCAVEKYNTVDLDTLRQLDLPPWFPTLLFFQLMFGDRYEARYPASLFLINKIRVLWISIVVPFGDTINSAFSASLAAKALSALLAAISASANRPT